MSKHLERDLDNLQQDLLALASSVEEAIHKATHALQDREPHLAQEVIEGDSLIDEEENHIEDGCLKILALHQPVAVDLRRIVSALKINTELERMADLAEDIADSFAVVGLQERQLLLDDSPHHGTHFLARLLGAAVRHPHRLQQRSRVWVHARARV